MPRIEENTEYRKKQFEMSFLFCIDKKPNLTRLSNISGKCH